MINGASGSVGSAAVQLAVVRGVRVVGTGSPASHDALRRLGAEPVSYGDGLVDRVQTIATTEIDFALDVAGSGVLPELVALTGSPDRVITVADVAGADRTGVRFSRGDSGRATYALAEVARMATAGEFVITVGRTFPLTEVAEAHRVGESGAVRGKLVLLVE